MLKTKEEMKQAFSEGSKPTSEDFSDLIDLIFDKKETKPDVKKVKKNETKPVKGKK